MPKERKSRKVAFCLLVFAASLEVWVLFDLWTGLGGELHKATRFWVLATSAMSLSASVIVRLYSLWAVKNEPKWRCSSLVFVIGVVSSIVIYVLGSSPPFSVSRPALEDWIESQNEVASSRVLASNPEGIRIGAFEFIKITHLSNGAFVFEESIPNETPYGSGLSFGDPSDFLKHKFQSFSLEPLEDGWFKYRGSL